MEHFNFSHQIFPKMPKNNAVPIYREPKLVTQWVVFYKGMLFYFPTEKQANRFDEDNNEHEPNKPCSNVHKVVYYQF